MGNDWKYWFIPTSESLEGDGLSFPVNGFQAPESIQSTYFSGVEDLEGGNSSDLPKIEKRKSK
jgi:hypothetical protein